VLADNGGHGFPLSIGIVAAFSAASLAWSMWLFMRERA
jgi:hypothetical protein